MVLSISDLIAVLEAGVNVLPRAFTFVTMLNLTCCAEVL